MKRIIFIMLLIAALVAPSLGQITPWNIHRKPTADWLTGQTPRFDPAWAWMKAVDDLMAFSLAGSATDVKVWWVDGSVSTTGNGESPNSPFLTIDEAIAVCDNSVDDWILINDYSGDTDTITVNKAFVHMIGYGNPGMPYPRIQASDAGAPGLTLTDAADRVEIAGLFFAANTTAPGIGFIGAAGSYDVWIHHCVFGRSGNASQDGINVGEGVGGAAPYLVVEDNLFGGIGGAGITRDGIRINNNASGAIIRRNIFQGCAERAVYLQGGCESIMVLDNTIKLPSDTEGYAVEVSTTSSRCLIMGNRATSFTGLLRTEVFHDADATSTNSFAGNTGGGLDTIIKQSERIVAARRGLIPGSSTLPVRIWYVDNNITTSGNGFTPFNALKTIQEAMTLASNTVDDYIIVFDYSGGTTATITIANSFVHLIGWNPSNTVPYPRIKPSTAVAGITITDAGDRIEITGFTIGGGSQAVPAITFSGGGGSYGVWIHDNIIGRDADAPGNDGILVPSGTAVPYCKIENNIFHGSAGAGLDESGIEIAGNATRGHIINNLFHDLGTGTHPAIYLSGSATEMSIEGNRIACDDDDVAGWAITLTTGCADTWVNGNFAGSGDNAIATEAWADDSADETNDWGLNYAGADSELPGAD